VNGKVRSILKANDVDDDDDDDYDVKGECIS